ncbi:MAG TPA: hypothetical protein VFH51_01375 [Myxococcota bacterium]|nr:hypothetical protein [Myxococcota bacterium]
MQDPAREVETQAFQQALRHELDPRIATFATYDITTFGHIGGAEAWIAGVLGIALPIFLFWLLA